MKTLCIYCCGGMGREIADLANRLNNWEKIVFVDDNIRSRIVDGLQVFTFDEIIKQFHKSDLEFIVTAGEPSFRKALYEKIEQQKLEYVSIIAPGFYLSKFSTIGKGTIMHIDATITVNVHIGKGCLINKHVVIGHDVNVGDYTVISPNVSVGGNVDIGHSCFIGSGAIIRNGIKIGENSIIGMGSVVLKDVEPNSVVAGNPAKFLRINENKRVFR